MIYYTVKDIEIITGLDEEEVIIIIKRLNEEIKEKFERVGKKPLLFDKMIESKYFLKKFNDLNIGGIYLWKRC